MSEPVACRHFAPTGTYELAPRYRLVLEMVADGMTMEKVAAELDIARRTVANRLGVVRRVLGAKSTEQAVAIAVRHGVIL